MQRLATDAAPLVMHIVHRFDTGGLENGLVNLINQMPANSYRHAVVALEAITEFKSRVLREDVEFTSLNKPSGHGYPLYPSVFRMLRRLRPAVVHTRNLGPLEMQVAAAIARVPVRIHGEHGRDLDDLTGANRRKQIVRRLFSPFVHRYVALSRDLEQYLVSEVGVASNRVVQIYNGVDCNRFRPAATNREPIQGCPFNAPDLWIFGTVGRMQGVKAPTLLAKAFVRALELIPRLRNKIRLIMIGEGPLREEAQAILATGGAAEQAWLPGERADIPEIMRGLNCFVLPSLAEGVSNTILEAMASGLPVIATCVGGNPELVAAGRTGELVPAADVDSLAHALCRMAEEPERAATLGKAGRADAKARFSIDTMVGAYRNLYDRECAAVGYERKRTG